MRQQSGSAVKLLVVSCLLWSGASYGKLFVPDIEPWAFWVSSDEECTIAIDHDDWQRFLDVYLATDYADGVNRVDYAGVTPEDRARLQVYIDRMSLTDPREYARAEQQVYWLNLYNALTVSVVLEHYPVKSIRKIYGGLLGTGPWNEALIEVAGQALSLNDIEHRILRPIWRDPRIHYAVNCASFGCPNLAADVYTASNADAMLDAGARAFINNPRGVDWQGGKLQLSSIYDWYDTDFGATREEQLQHIAIYADEELAQRLQEYSGRIRYDYDWRLNAQ